MLEQFGARCESFVRRYMPDPFVLVLLLTIFTFGLALWTTNSRPPELLKFWHKGFWELLSFGMQMVLIVVTGEAIASTSLVQRALRKFALLPRTPRSAVAGLTFLSVTLGWLHWGFGLVMASLAGRELAKSLYHRKITVHYPVIGAAAYMSMLLWHAGTTASAPLLINTPGHFLFKEIGLIPLSQTIFLPMNLIACLFLVIMVTFLIPRLLPRRNIRTIDNFDVELKPGPIPRHSQEKAKSFSEKLEQSYLINAIVAGFGFAFLVHYFRTEGLNLNHNIVNLILLTIGLALHRNPIEYAKAIAQSTRGTSGIILQFPFYGGIMGILGDSGLGKEIAQVFIQFATPKTLPFIAYITSVLTKIFVPSGGGEWAIEGPVMLQAAKQIGASIGYTTMGIAYGNMVGNMFQPFWAIPLLSIMGMKARDIMGYCLVVFFFAFPILGIALFIS